MMSGRAMLPNPGSIQSLSSLRTNVAALWHLAPSERRLHLIGGRLQACFERVSLIN